MKTLIQNGTVVTLNNKSEVLNADLLIGENGRIEALFPRASLTSQTSRDTQEELSLLGPIRLVDAKGCAILPAFVQAHVHLCQTLFRSMADDLPLLAWLKERIWPYEAAHTEKSLFASSELGLLEMMKAGTGTIFDMGTVHHHDAVFEACKLSGIRAFSGKAMMDLPTSEAKGLKETTKESLDESERLKEFWHGKENGRLHYAYAPRFILSCTETLFREVAERAKAHKVHMHTHAAEHAEEREAVRGILGMNDVEALRAWGFTGPLAVWAHGVQLTKTEMNVLANDGTRIVHCPSANLKLGSGIAPIHEMKQMGLSLALGADGAPCNNRLDPWFEMREAALLAKIKSGVTTLPAQEALELATKEGAKALGIFDETGSLEIGKWADLSIVDLTAAHAEPGENIYSKLVYSCGASDVNHVFVQGKHVVRNGEHRFLCEDTLLEQARIEAKSLRVRASML